MVIHDLWIEIQIEPAARFNTKAGQRSVETINPVKRRSWTQGSDSRVDTRTKPESYPVTREGDQRYKHFCQRFPKTTHTIDREEEK